MKIVTLGARPPVTLQLIGGRLCLDFVNSIGARRDSRSGEMTIRDEKLTSYIDLVEWASQAGALDASAARALARDATARPHEAAAKLAAALRFREALYRILKCVLAGAAPDDADLAHFNQQLRGARSAEVLTASRKRLEWKLKTRSPDSRRILWAVALSAADLLTRDDLSRLRQCNGDDCGWLFFDGTRNRSRNWCRTGDCGNRDRVRRFRARERRRVARATGGQSAKQTD